MLASGDDPNTIDSISVTLNCRSWEWPGAQLQVALHNFVSNAVLLTSLFDLSPSGHDYRICNRRQVWLMENLYILRTQ